MVFLGIDPGLKGGMALLDNEGRIIRIWEDAPVLNGSYDPVGAVERFADIDATYHPVTACIELVHSFPKIGVVTNFKQGYCAGLYHGALAARKIPYYIASPQSWKKKILIGIPPGKESSVVYVNNRYPEFGIMRYRNKETRHNISDAICIALFGRMKYLGEQ